MEYNVLAEFERYGIVIHDWVGTDSVRVTCPFHDDDPIEPHCDVDTKKRVFICRSAKCSLGKDGGDVISLLARFTRVTRAVVELDLAKIYGSDTDKTIDIQLVESYHDRIWKANALRQELYNRGLDDEDIRKYRLGVDDDARITIPIRNGAGHIVNIRRYKPGAPSKEKMKNTKGYSKIRLFPYDQLRFDKIVICGGECKAIVAARQLNPYGIGAISATHGESNWSIELTRELIGKSQIWTCLDIDEGGQRAALDLCYQLQNVADWLGNIILPLDIDKYPHGDINDFVMLRPVVPAGDLDPWDEQPVDGQLLPLLEACPQYEPPISKLDYDCTEIPEELELNTAIHANKTGKRVTLTALVSAMDTAPYPIPKDVVIICGKDAKCCGMCPVFIHDKSDFLIPPESPTILEMIAAHKNSQLPVIMDAISIPVACRVCTFEAKSHYNIEDARISSELDVTNRNADKVMMPAFCVGDGLNLNETYRFSGRMFPHPKTQQAVMLFSAYEPTQDALSSYKLADDNGLAVHWPSEWTLEGIENKLTEIYDDFSANVTHIIKRPDLHLFTDLSYFSPLHITFEGRVRKGCTEVLIIGDSSQGKSEVTVGSDAIGGLLLHYQLGQKVSLKSASVAGIIGGVSKSGDRHFIQWGELPQHDKRHVTFEEVSGASVEVIGAMTDVRSSGEAIISKIEKRRCKCRVRLLWVANARSKLRISQHNFGISAIRELIGANQDVRRFDAALIVADTEITPEELNVLLANPPVVEHIYTTELERELLLWTWTRTPEQVIFTDEATALVLEESVRLCGEFTQEIPLIDRGSIRLKLARLGAAVAARLFSCSEDYQTLIVYPAHVEYIVKTLRRVYSSRIFGYSDYTAAIEVTQTLIDVEEIKLKINSVAHAVDLVRSILGANKIDITDLQDWCGFQRDDAQILLSFFVRKHCFMRDGKLYRKTSPFIDLLKAMLDSGEVKNAPGFIPRVEGY